MRLALVLLAACYTAPLPPSAPRAVVRYERITCLVVQPPPAPEPVDCAKDGIEDWWACEHQDNAVWADYAHRAQRWIDLYAWPTCRSARP